MKIGFLLEKLSGPARRALSPLGLKTVEDLARHTKRGIMELHGIGPSAMGTIEAAMDAAGIVFKAEAGDAEAKSGRTGKGPVDAYIETFPPDVRKLLRQVRATIKDAVPDAEEKIAYGMPTFALRGNVVHFAAFKHHIGLYPLPSGMEAFKAELSRYKQGKGSMQFPLDEPMPLDLIARIAKFRAEENRAKARKKKERA